jgi:signal transduction histidine kinase/CheY-like chemotaxis protein
MSRDVLLVEDDPIYRASLVHLYAPDGYRFFEAASPSEGIRILEDNPHIQVVLLDLSFQNHSGTVVLDHIRERGDHYRVIVLTAHDELLAMESAREYGLFNYLPKTERSSHPAIRFSLDQAFKDLDRAVLRRKMDYLLKVQKRINENRDRKGTLDLVCEGVQSIVGAYTCHIRVYDFKRGDFHLEGFSPDGPLRQLFDTPRAKGVPFSGRVVRTGKPERCNDLQQDPEFRELRRKALARRNASTDADEYWKTASSAYIVPISTGFFGKLVDAVLNVSSQSPGFFDDEKCAQVDEFVHQANIAITKDWLQRKRGELQEDYSIITEMLSTMRNHLLAGPEVLRRIYSTVTQQLAALVNAEVVSVFLYNDRTARIEKVAEYRGNEHVEEPDEAYEVGKSYVGAVFDGGTIHLQATPPGKPLDDPRYDHSGTEQYAHIIPSGKLEHYVGVPIVAGGTTQGVLRVMNKKSEYYGEVMGNGGVPTQPGRLPLLERGFTLDCRHVVEITASHLAIAIQNAELLQEEERQLEEMQNVGAAGRYISSRLDIDEVLKETLAAMAAVMHAEICMLFLLDDGEDQVVLTQCYGIPEKELAGASYRLGEGVTGMVAETGEARLIGKAQRNDGKFDARIQRYLTEKDGRPREIESLMVVPIRGKAAPLGVMKVINKVGEDPRYRENDLKLFNTFGRYVGGAIENARIYKRTNERLAIAEETAALSVILRVAAHEIRNTSGIIPANVMLIRKALSGPDDSIDRMLTLIEENAVEATEFANEIDGFSSTGSDQKQALDINEVIREAMDALRFDVPRYDPSMAIRVDAALSEDPLVCDIYRRAFIQIVRNIVINALQALDGREDGFVRVTSRGGVGEAEPVAAITFEDNGLGILPSHVERIFDGGFTTKKGKGSGVGLWLVRKHLDLLRGTIEVDSRRGEGTTFLVRIPLVPPRAVSCG